MELSSIRDIFQYGQIALAVFLAIFTGLATHYQKRVEEQKSTQRNEADTQYRKEIQTANEKLGESNARLEDVQKKMEPFLNAAVNKFPSVDINAALASLRNELQAYKSTAEKLSKSVASRNLTEAARNDLVTFFSAIRSRKASITSILGDSEAFGFAEQLKSVLEKAGWDVSGIDQAVYTKAMPGIIIVGAESETETLKSIALKLRSHGMRAFIDPNRKDRPNEFEFIVGVK